MHRVIRMVTSTTSFVDMNDVHSDKTDEVNELFLDINDVYSD